MTQKYNAEKMTDMSKRFKSCRFKIFFPMGRIGKKAKKNIKVNILESMRCVNMSKRRTCYFIRIRVKICPPPTKCAIGNNLMFACCH